MCGTIVALANVVVTTSQVMLLVTVVSKHGVKLSGRSGSLPVVVGAAVIGKTDLVFGRTDLVGRITIGMASDDGLANWNSLD